MARVISPMDDARPLFKYASDRTLDQLIETAIFDHRLGRSSVLQFDHFDGEARHRVRVVVNITVKAAPVTVRECLPATAPEIAAMLGGTTKNVTACLIQLERAGLARRSGNYVQRAGARGPRLSQIWERTP